MNVGKIVFAQIMQFIPRREFNDIVAKYRGNYRVRNLTCYDQLLVMCLAQYADKNSLRDIEALDIDNMVYAFDSSTASCLLHDA